MSDINTQHSLFKPRDHHATHLPRGRTLHTLTAISDHKLFLFGGLSTNGEVLSKFKGFGNIRVHDYFLNIPYFFCLGDGWEFDTVTKEWRERDHVHKDKPRQKYEDKSVAKLESMQIRQLTTILFKHFLNYYFLDPFIVLFPWLSRMTSSNAALSLVSKLSSA